MAVLLTILSILLLLVGNEIWARRQQTHSEFSRKFIHITVGSFVAFWPFFLSWRQIELLSLAFVVVVLLSQSLGLFKAIHRVQRSTWGELCFAAAVGLVALLTHDKWIYVAALLQMSLADGLAAVIGQRYGRGNHYRVLGHTKSLVGTLTFFVVSLIILVAINHHLAAPLAAMTLVGISILASVVENIGIRGLDNLLVPLLVTLILM
jgi:phytol kinase